MDPTPDLFQPSASGPPSPERWNRILPIERAAAALEVAVCSGFPTQLVVVTVLTTFGMKVRLADGSLSSNFVFALTLIDTILVIGLVLFFLRAHRESARELLLGSRPIGREALFGIGLIPASFGVVITVLFLVQIVMPSLRNVPHNPLQDLVHSRRDAVLFALVVMIAGGVREEIQRAFVLRRFEQYLGGAAVGLAIFSVLFGLGHVEQGYDVMLATMVLGAFWGAIYLRRRSVVGPMVGHAGFNLAQVVKFLTIGG